MDPTGRDEAKDIARRQRADCAQGRDGVHRINPREVGVVEQLGREVASVKVGTIGAIDGSVDVVKLIFYSRGY